MRSSRQAATHSGDTGARRLTDVRTVSMIRRARGLPHPAWAYATFSLLLVAGQALTSLELVDAILYEAVGLAAFVAIVAGARRQSGRQARAWYFLGTGLALWIAGDVFWNVQGLLLEIEPFPSTADALYLLGYPALGAGVLLLVRQGDRQGRLLGWLDTALIAIACALVMWLGVGVFEGGLSSLADAVTHAYSLADLVLVAVLARLAFVPGSRTMSFRLLTSGLVLMLIADAFYYAPALQGLVPAEPLEVFFLVSYTAIGAAALHPSAANVIPSTPETADPNAKRRLLVPAAGLVVGSLVVAILAPSSGLGLWVAALAALALALLVLGRFVLLVQALERLRAGADRLLELERTHNEQLLELDVLKDSFVANVSHELRTPLTSIRGYLELVLEAEAGDLTDDQRRFLTIVERNSDRLLRLVGDLLFVAQVDAGRIALELGRVDLAAIVEDSVQSAQPAADQTKTVLSIDQQPVPPFTGDPARLAQLLDSLVSNALKFTPTGGSVTVRCGTHGRHAFLEVQDSGIGIPVKEQSLLFERFYRARAAAELAIQGTGLGLAVAKAIVDGHHGTITVESAENRGATFRVELPLVPVDLASPPPAMMVA